MQKLNVIASRLKTFGRLDRGGKISIQHQIGFLRANALDDDSYVDNNFDTWTEEQLSRVVKDEYVDDLIEEIGEVFTNNVHNTEEVFFPIPEAPGIYKDFLKRSALPMPEISNVRIEIRQAPVFSQSIYYFARSNENFEKIQREIAGILADNDLPAEMINISFSVVSRISLTEMYRVMVFFSVVLREAGRTTGFVPGRIIGNFENIYSED